MTVFAAFAFRGAVADDGEAATLEVAADEEKTIEADATYDTVTVHGKLNIASGAKLTATNIALGPSEGDAAVINVLGPDEESLVATTMTIGANGGTGKIVALSPGETHNKGYDGKGVLYIETISVAAEAASTDGVIDILTLGPGLINFKNFVNDSDARARILVNDGRLGYKQYWGATMFAGNFRIEAFGSGTPRIGGSYAPYKLNASGNGSLVIDGNGGDIIFSAYTEDKDTQMMTLNSGLEWTNVKDVRLQERKKLVLAADDLLPYGQNVGILHVEDDLGYVNVQTKTLHLNGLDAPSSSASGAIRGDAGSKVVFGEGDVDGTLHGVIQSTVAVEKTGTGTLTVAGASTVGALAVSGGKLSVKNALTLDSLSVAEGATLEIDGVTLSTTTGLTDVRGELVLLNGGRLLTTVGGDVDARIPGTALGGEVTKTGSGLLILEDPAALSDTLRVSGGTLAFCAAGYDFKLFKAMFTDWQYPRWSQSYAKNTKKFLLSEFALMASDGTRLNLGMDAADTGTPPGELAANKAAFAEGCVVDRHDDAYGNSAYALFEGSAFRVLVDSPATTDEGGVTLYMRLKDDASPVSFYNMSPAWGGDPKSWSVSASSDGGETWIELSSYSDAPSSTWSNDTWAGTTDALSKTTPIPTAFPLYSTDPALARKGTLANMPEAMRVEVDAGATLDYSNVEGGQVVDALTLDAANDGGTIKAAAFAADGTLTVYGLAEGATLRGAVIPVDLSASAGTSNFKRWTLVADGKVQKTLRAKYAEGKMEFTSVGFAVVVR